MKTTIHRTSLFFLLLINALPTASLVGAEIPLWPLLRMEKSRTESEQGSNIEVLWPLVALDTTKPKTAFAVRPLISYDANRKTGTFLFPIGWFGSQHLIVAPILWTDWGEKPHFVLAPIYGQWKGRETGYVIGPGLFLRSSGPERERIGSVVPLIFRIKSNDGNDQRDWVLTYYQRRGDARKDTALFPFAWSRSGKTGDLHWTNLEVYPLFGIRRESDSQGEKSRRVWVLWPLADVTDHRDGYKRNLVGYTVQWGKKDDAQWHAILPLYYLKDSTEKHTFALPMLGFYRHLNRATGEHRWLAWPFAGHRQTPETDAWHYLSGLIQYRESKSAESQTLAPLWPLVEWESTPDLTRHRFWPLYRYTAQKGPAAERRFFALAEMIGYQNGERLEGGFWFLLRPVTFQQSNSGEKHVRWLWKLVESHTTHESRAWAINPLFHSFTDLDSKRWDFLGGLFGMKRRENQTSVRALWFLNFRLYRNSCENGNSESQNDNMGRSGAGKSGTPSPYE